MKVKFYNISFHKEANKVCFLDIESKLQQDSYGKTFSF